VCFAGAEGARSISAVELRCACARTAASEELRRIWATSHSVDKDGHRFLRSSPSVLPASRGESPSPFLIVAFSSFFVRVARLADGPHLLAVGRSWFLGAEVGQRGGGSAMWRSCAGVTPDLRRRCARPLIRSIGLHLLRYGSSVWFFDNVSVRFVTS